MRAVRAMARRSASSRTRSRIWRTSRADLSNFPKLDRARCNAPGPVCFSSYLLDDHDLTVLLRAVGPGTTVFPLYQGAYDVATSWTDRRGPRRIRGPHTLHHN